MVTTHFHARNGLVLCRKLARAGNGPLSSQMHVSRIEKKDSRHCAQQLSLSLPSRHMQVQFRQGLCRWPWIMLPWPRAFSGIACFTESKHKRNGRMREYIQGRGGMKQRRSWACLHHSVPSQPLIVWRKSKASFASYVHNFFLFFCFLAPWYLFPIFMFPQPDDWLWACPTNRKIEDGDLSSIFGSFDGSLNFFFFFFL